MATNILHFCLLAILLLLKESHAMVAVATSKSPAPAPAPGPGPAPAPAPTPGAAPKPKPGPEAAPAAPAPESNKNNGTSEGSLKPQDCGPRCAHRCSNTQYKKPCLFFCKKCCAKCLCVPPGTYGNKEVCPCYNNWKTKRGGPKCP
ncbi:hypothetical protein PHAVU_007G248900 [Phaseolus vulgaris]|uniref:Uncharacterized protein n=1 Tax=Phaseolus vulgaris TaxID=3885 RepID=V7BKJ5_PHAVU|nr:hypothetical protein PHAVU_007G248900g [Phaseolus vulgaris]ESW17553.1 hypothetical protein PHAVU_007G248900g [Phaseolus vulgaris]